MVRLLLTWAQLLVPLLGGGWSVYADDIVTGIIILIVTVGITIVVTYVRDDYYANHRF